MSIHSVDSRNALVDQNNQLLLVHVAISSVSEQLRHINTSMNLLVMNGDTLARELARIKATLDPVLLMSSCVGCGAIDTSQLTLNVDFRQVCAGHRFLLVSTSHLVLLHNT